MQIPALDFKHIKFHESFDPQKLLVLDAAWLNYLAERRPDLAEVMPQWRDPSHAMSAAVVTAGLLAMAPIFADFVAELFTVSSALEARRDALRARDPVYWFKQNIIRSQLRRYISSETDMVQSCQALLALSQLETLTEVGLASWVHQQQDQFTSDSKLRTTVLDFCNNLAQAKRSQINQTATNVVLQVNQPFDVNTILAVTADWVMFNTPKRIDFTKLIDLKETPLTHDARGGFLQEDSKHTTTPSTRLDAAQMVGRQGFDLQDHGRSSERLQDEANYCIYCHEKDNDFCRKGFPAKEAQSTHDFKINPLQDELTGCPLDEKISEMNLLRRQGLPLAALAVAMVDNPLVAATGHRICNDCMKSCIYQKQAPVNIPEIESGNLREVLNLPWGVEIYDLMTRWNPLRRQEFILQPLTGRKVAIMGMGPAGFTAAHHLTMAGHTVVGFDGLKIEPLQQTDLHAPIYQFSEIDLPLSQRMIHGFGGVAEYGITARWNKII